jgi:hypothetical protein
VIPFTTVKDNITTETPSTFMYYYSPNKIETLIKIGTPPQELALRIKLQRYPISVNSVQMTAYKTIRFNETISSSYIQIGGGPRYFGEHDFNQAIQSKEIFNFNNNKLVLNNFTFLLGVTSRYNPQESGVLGLKLPEFDHRILDVCFIKQIKEMELIHNYTFFIKYNENDDNGEVIFGSLPHEIDSNKYNEKNYEDFYATIVSNSLGLTVKEAFYGEDYLDGDFDVELAVEDNFIRGNEAFKSFLNDKYFKKYIERRICQTSFFSYLDEDKCEFIYCSKKINLTDFKNIKLSIDVANLTIELNYKDLFYEYNDNYYFLMYFPTKYYSYIHFRLGKILFKKYILSFNYDNKRIGYYKEVKTDNNNNNISDKDGKSYSYLIPWIIITVLVIIIVLLCFYIFYYKPCKNRVKRANELKDDNYVYQGINE